MQHRRVIKVHSADLDATGHLPQLQCSDDGTSAHQRVDPFVPVPGGYLSPFGGQYGIEQGHNDDLVAELYGPHLGDLVGEDQHRSVAVTDIDGASTHTFGDGLCHFGIQTEDVPHSHHRDRPVCAQRLFDERSNRIVIDRGGGVYLVGVLGTPILPLVERPHDL